MKLSLSNMKGDRESSDMSKGTEAVSTKEFYITTLRIDKVRHLNNIQLPVSHDKKTHLILTGKNGSGKTSLLDAIAGFLNSISTSNDPMEAMRYNRMDDDNLKYLYENDVNSNDIFVTQERIKEYRERIKNAANGVWLELNQPLEDVKPAFERGEMILAYYKTNRVFRTILPTHIEKVDLKDNYNINDSPRDNLVKYLLDLKMTQALAGQSGRKEKADVIKLWFDRFEKLLKQIFEDDTLRLCFDEETFRFRIVLDGREPFDFNSLSSGYAALLDIAVDLIMRMEKHTDRTFDFNISGIVLIDEIETHLHLEMQKTILPFLTSFFPNIQFIVSTHSPFVLNSIENCTIYDLENRIIASGLTEIPYEGIVEGYFGADRMSEELREKYESYRLIAEKDQLAQNDYEKVAELELYLDDIPDYLSPDYASEYRRLKLELRNKEKD